MLWGPDVGQSRFIDMEKPHVLDLKDGLGPKAQRKSFTHTQDYHWKKDLSVVVDAYFRGEQLSLMAILIFCSKWAKVWRKPLSPNLSWMPAPKLRPTIPCRNCDGQGGLQVPAPEDGTLVEWWWPREMSFKWGP